MPNRRLATQCQELRARIINLLGNRCWQCGYHDIRALQIDHVKSEGYWKKRQSTITYYKEVWRSIIAGEGHYQLLCANCNWIKKAENNER